MKRIGFVLLVFLTLLVACGPAEEEETEPTETPTPEATNTPEGKPTIAIDAPPSGSETAVGENVFIQSTSTDVAGVVRVVLTVDGVQVSSDEAADPEGQPTFTLLQSWTPTTTGTATLEVTAFRGDGTASDPASITIDVLETAEEVAQPIALPPMLASLPPTQTSGPCQRVIRSHLNLRDGPGTSYDKITTLVPGAQVDVNGTSADGGWLAVSASGQSGWISAGQQYSYASGDCSSVPVQEYDPAQDTQDTEDTQVTQSVTPPEETQEVTQEVTQGGPTATYTLTPSYTPTTQEGVVAATATYTPSYTPTTPPAAQVAPEDANFNSPLNIPLDNTASVLDFVSYPGGDTEDRVRWDITGMNPTATSSGGRARLTIQSSCFGTGTENLQFFTGGQTYACGQTLVDTEVTYDSRTGQVTITATGGAETYVQWVLTGTATRTN